MLLTSSRSRYPDTRSLVSRLLILLALALSPTSAAAQAWYTVIDDEFIEPDGTALAGHVPETNLPGGTWQVGGAPALIVQNQAIRPSGFGAFDAYATIDALVSDGEIGLYLFGSPSIPADQLRGGVIFRWVSSTNYMLAHYREQRVWLWKMTPAGFVHIAYADVDSPQNTYRWLAVRASGSSITVNWHGADVIAVTDSTNQTATRHGIWFWSSFDPYSTITMFRVRSQQPMQPPTVTSVAATPNPLDMPIASSTTVTATGYSASNVAVPSAIFSWVSSNPSVAWIQSSTQNTAQIVATNVGAATVTATAQSGASVTIPVAVTNFTAQVKQVLIHDEFIDPDGTSLGEHVPETNLSAGTWSLGGSTGIVLQGQAVKPAGAGPFDAYATIDSRSSDADVGLYWHPYPAGDNSLVAGGVIFRYASATSYLLAHYWQEQVWLWRMTPTGFVHIANAAVPPPYGSWHWLEIRGVGATVTVNWDGVDKIQVVDDTNLVSTRHGLWFRNVADPHSVIGTFRVQGTLPEPVTSVVVTPDPVTIPVAGAATLSAKGYGAGGTYVPSTTFTWSLTPSGEVASLTTTGLNTTKVVGGTEGSVEVTATATGGATGAVPVTVVPTCLGLCVFDSFTGTGALEAHTPDTNVMDTAWVVEGGPTVSVYSDRIRSTANGYTLSLSTIEGGNTNGTVQAVWYPPAPGTVPSPNFGLLARYVSSDQYFLATYEAGRVKLFRRYTGGIEQIGDAPVYGDLGAEHQMQIRLDGPGIQVWWDGEQTIQAIDPAYAGATRHGVYWNVENDPASYLDNFIFVGMEQSVAAAVTVSSSTISTVAQGHPLFLDAQAFTAGNAWIPWTSFTWHSSNSAVAFVESLGHASARVVGLASGRTTITATSAEGLTATFDVLVTIPESDTTVRVFDTFVDTQHTYLSNHVPDVYIPGAFWTTAVPDAIQINDVNSLFSTPRTGFEVGTIESGTANGTVSANWRPLNASIYANGGIVFRHVDDTSYWYALVIEHALHLKRVDGGVHTTVASVGIGNPTGGVHQIAALLDGPRIEIWFNGMLQIQVTDPANELATRHGVSFYSAYNTDSNLDDFSVNAEFITPTLPPQPVLPCFNGAWPPNGQHWSAAGGTDTVTLSAPPDCAWHATAGASWIHLAATSGTGDAYLEYSVESNPGSARGSTITINSWTFRISQSAPTTDGPPPFPSPTQGVQIVRPVAHAAFMLSEPVAIHVLVRADTEPITRVDFVVDGAVVGSDASPPFELYWTPTTVGAHLLVAHSWNGASLAHTSDEVPIQVVGASCEGAPLPNPNDDVPDDLALNCLIDAGGIVSLKYGYPGYIVASGLVVRSGNVSITGDGGWRPILIADPWLDAPMVRVSDGASDYSIRDVIFDGNRIERILYQNCEEDYYDLRTHGYNLLLRGSSFLIENIYSVGALCGSALEVGNASSFVIRNNFIIANGYQHGELGTGLPNSQLDPWADGITLTSCNDGDIYGNYLEDNTDIDLIVGPGSNCAVYENTVVHRYRYGFAGIMLGFPGDRSNIEISGNSISSGLDLLSIGLMVGHDPWKDVAPFSAGLVANNTVRGAVTLLWVAGVSEGSVVGNQLQDRQGTRQMFGCTFLDAYSAGDFGGTTLQEGFTYRTFVNGVCQ